MAQKAAETIEKSGPPPGASSSRDVVGLSTDPSPNVPSPAVIHDESLGPEEVDPETEASRPRYGPGRPRKGEIRNKAPKLPRPPQMGIVPPAKFFKYWHDTDKAYPDRLQAYVYRRWPVCDREGVGLKKYLEVLVVGDQIKSEDILPETVESTFLHRYGSGDYKIMLRDGGRNELCCTCMLIIRDPDYPPIVEPLRSLDMADPSNRKFIEDLRRRGVRLPGDETGGTTNEEGEDEMAKVAVATEVLANTVKDMADKNMEMAAQAVEQARRAAEVQRERGEEPEEKQPPSADVLSTGLQIVSQAASMGSKIIETAVSKVGEIQREVVPPQPDPVKMIEGFVTLTNSIVSAREGGGDKLTDRLLEKLDESEKRAQEALQKQNDLLQSLLLRGNPSAVAGVPPPPGAGVDLGAAPVSGAAGQVGAVAGGGLLSQIREMTAVKRELQDLLGISEEEGAANPARGTASGGFLERYGPVLLQFAMMLGTGIYNLIASRAGAPPMATPDIASAGQQELPPPPTAPVAAQQVSQPPKDPTLAAIHQYLAQLTEPLLTALNTGESGADFAENMCRFMGQNAYDYLVEMGPDKLIQILSTYPPIWSKVQAIPGRFQQFLSEFFAYSQPEAENGVAPVGAAPAAVSPSAVRQARERPAAGPGLAQDGPGGSKPNHRTPPRPASPAAV